MAACKSPSFTQLPRHCNLFCDKLVAARCCTLQNRSQICVRQANLLQWGTMLHVVLLGKSTSTHQKKHSNFWHHVIPMECINTPYHRRTGSLVSLSSYLHAMHMQRAVTLARHNASPSEHIATYTLAGHTPALCTVLSLEGCCPMFVQCLDIPGTRTHFKLALSTTRPAAVSGH